MSIVLKPIQTFYSLLGDMLFNFPFTKLCFTGYNKIIN